MRALATLLSIFFASSFISTESSASLLLERAERYAPIVNYDVYRNDKPVGQYRINFEPSPERLKVEVEMQIETKIFGLFNYDYHYRAREVWRNDQLESLAVTMVTNGDEEQIQAKRQGDLLEVIDQKGRERMLPAGLLTTHHWFDTILTQSKVLNTLNGKTSEIAVKSESEQIWMIDGLQVPVTGFRLGGDLDNTLSWYDEAGIWRGMTFKAKDGSTIDVRWRGAQT